MLSVGIDVGGTGIKGVALEGGVVTAHTHSPTPANDPSAIVSTIVSAVNQLRGDSTAPVGVAVAAFIDAPRRTIRFSPNISWSDFPLADLLEERLGQRVVIDNDANAACYGEYVHGAGVGSDCLAMLTLGTGVGGAVMVDGRLVTGAGGVAGELGHLPLANPKRQCGCGGFGCVETVASGTAIVQAVSKAAGVRDDPDTIAAVLANDSTLREQILDEVGEVLARTILTLIQVTDPDRIVLGGGVMDRSGELVIETIEKARLRLFDSRQALTWPDVVPARLGNRAGGVGAAMLALHRTESLQ